MKIELTRKELVTLYDVLSAAYTSTPPGTHAYSEIRTARTKVRDLLSSEGFVEPEREVHYIDVGNVPPEKLEAYISEQMKKIKELKEDEQHSCKKPFSMNDTRFR